MTSNVPPAPPEHDRRRASYSPHSTRGGSIVFDSRCRRCWYEKAKTEDAALLEAVDMLMKALHVAMIRGQNAIAAAEGRTA